MDNARVIALRLGYVIKRGCRILKKICTQCAYLVKSQVKINKFFQRKIVNIFLPFNFNICFGCSKEPSH